MENATDTRGTARRGPSEHGKGTGGTYKVRPLFLYFKSYFTNPPHPHPPEHEKHARLGMFLILPNSDMFYSTHNPRKRVPQLVFGEVDHSSATTITHNPRKRAPRLVFGEFNLALATTTTHNPRKRAPQLVFGRLTLPWQPHHPPPPKMSRRARFWGYDLSLATTSIHNPPKMSTMTHFWEVDLPLAITIPENEPSHSFSGV
jgi:hypothetical protein